MDKYSSNKSNGTEIVTPVIFYDGVCGLCDRVVQFLIQRDRRKVFRYAALQSDFSHQVLGEHISFDSFIYYEKGKAYYRSTAALRTLRKLGGLWSLSYIFMIVPRFVRDAVYDWVARNRYKWFGKFDSCKIPTPEQRTLFLD